MNNLPQQQFGSYQVVEQIHQGSNAIIYKGYQPSLDRAVAIKVLNGRDAQFAARFQREARVIGQLEHANILPIYEYGEQDGALYFVMQYVDSGFSVADLLGEPVEPVYAIELMLRLLDALGYAHQRGILHRDIKPSNMLLPLPNWPVLTDFGVVQAANDQQSLTMPELSRDRAHYMAPEHADGQPVDARTDLYALGAVLYHMLVGHAPFDAKTPIGVLQQHAYAPLPSARSLRPDLPEALERVLERALAKQPNERYQTARLMAADLRQALAQIAQTEQAGRVGALYAAGVQAFGEGAWAEAVTQLRAAHALDPMFAHVTELLALAEAGQQRARSEGQAMLARVQQRSSTQLRLDTPIRRSPQGAPYQTLHLPPDEVAPPPAAAAPPRVRSVVLGLLVLLALLVLLGLLLHMFGAWATLR